jgi:hypothetical protein
MAATQETAPRDGGFSNPFITLTWSGKHHFKTLEIGVQSREESGSRPHTETA